MRGVVLSPASSERRDLCLLAEVHPAAAKPTLLVALARPHLEHAAGLTVTAPAWFGPTGSHQGCCAVEILQMTPAG